MTEDELLKPTRYRVDHGTMTMQPEKSIPTMQITVAGSPPVFIRDGAFYSQDGSEYNLDKFPGGEEGFHKHLRETANADALSSHGVDFGDRESVRAKNAAPPEPPKTNQASNFAASDKDIEKDPELVYETLGDHEMDKESISKVAGITAQRVGWAIEKLGDRLERLGEGRKGSPYLFRRTPPTE